MKRALTPTMLVPLVALALLAGGCNRSTNTAETYCTTLTQYETGIQALVDLDPANASQGQYLTLWDNVLTTYNQLAEIQQDQAQAEQKAFQQAHQDLDTAVKALPSSATGDQAIAVLKPLIQKVDDAEKALSTAACAPAS